MTWCPDSRTELVLARASESVGLGVARRLYPQATRVRRGEDPFDLLLAGGWSGGGFSIEAKCARTTGRVTLTEDQAAALESATSASRCLFVWVAYDRRIAAALLTDNAGPVTAVARSVGYVLVIGGAEVADELLTSGRLRPDRLLRRLLSNGSDRVVAWRLAARAGGARIVLPACPIVVAEDLPAPPDLRTDRERRGYGAATPF